MGQGISEVKMRTIYVSTSIGILMTMTMMFEGKTLTIWPFLRLV